MRGGGYAFYSDAATAYPAISRLFEPGQICDLNQIELRTENTLGMTLRKNSPYWKTIKIKYVVSPPLFIPHPLPLLRSDLRQKRMINAITILTVTVRLFRIREVGLLAKHQHFWLPAKPECMANSYVFSVGMEYTAPIFIFLAISITTSMIILLLEIMHHRFMQMKHRPRHPIRLKLKNIKMPLDNRRIS